MSVRSAVLMAIMVGAAIASLGAERKVQMKDLPAAVQKAIQDQTAGAELKGVSKEVEGGKTFYEAETVVDGRTRDLLFDASGKLVEIEDCVVDARQDSQARAADQGREDRLRSRGREERQEVGSRPRRGGQASQNVS